jgi:hypothetical protein
MDNRLRLSVRMNYLLTVVILVLAVALLYKFGLFNLFSPSFGNTLAGINNPLTPAQLAVINGAPNSYFETAGERLLNGTLNNRIITAQQNESGNFPTLITGGKPTVIYIGSISCVWCGSNRWAMALALSRFGSFGSLYNGYSALQDSDVPTLYWSVNNVTTTSGYNFKNNYTSSYITFISAEYDSPITKGFSIVPISYFVQNATNSTTRQAMMFMNSTGLFSGTPFTYWGNTILRGSDGIVFGNSTPSGSSLPLTNMTHQQVLDQLKNFNDQFAWSQYAAADVYISYVCPTIKNAASVCSLPAIEKLEQVQGLS